MLQVMCTEGPLIAPSEIVFSLFNVFLAVRDLKAE